MTHTRWLAVAMVAGAMWWLAPSIASAQPGAITDSRGTVEMGVVHEWFHRELEPAPYQDTRWNITSLALTYGAADWLTLGFMGGVSNYQPDDFPDSYYRRYCVGATAAVGFGLGRGWGFGAHGRYLDTFDRGTDPNYLHSRIRSLEIAADLAWRSSLFGQALAVWGGPLYVDDLAQAFPFDSHTSFDSNDGRGWGAEFGGRVVLAGHLSLFGYANYVEQLQGGVGIFLHAGKGWL